MLNFFWIFTDNLITILPFAFLCFYPLKRYSRFSVKKTALLTLLFVAAASTADALVMASFSERITDRETLNFLSNVVYITAVVLCFAWCVYTIKTIWQKKVFVFLFVLCGALFTITFANFFLGMFPTKEGQLIFANCSIVVFSAASECITIPLLYLFFRRFYLPIERNMDKKELGFLSIPMLILFVILFAIFTFLETEGLYSNPTESLLYFGILAMLFVLYTVMFRMCRLIRDRQAASEKLMQNQYQMNIRDEQYRRICANIEGVRRQRHDMRHHMTTLRCFLENGDTQKAVEYLNQYLGNCQNPKITSYSENPVINMIVSHYAELALDRGIRFSVHIQFPDALPSNKLTIENIDISVLLGNLLENAIDASSELPVSERDIKLNILQQGNMLAVTVDNNFNGNVRQKDGAYLSTKPEHNGLGLSSLTDIAEKYHGGVEFRHTNKTFSSSIVLKLD